MSIVFGKFIKKDLYIVSTIHKPFNHLWDYLSISLNALPALKAGTLHAAIWILAPV